MRQQIAEEDKALEPVVTWHNEPDRGYTAVKICTWDRAGSVQQDRRLAQRRRAEHSQRADFHPQRRHRSSTRSS